MATINGKPSVFRQISNPPEVEACRFTNNPEFDFEAYMNAMTMSALEMAADLEAQETEWLNDPVAQVEYTEYCKALDEAERAEYEADMEQQAEAAELACLGDAGLHAISGHDLVWQVGGVI